MKWTEADVGMRLKQVSKWESGTQNDAMTQMNSPNGRIRPFCQVGNLMLYMLCLIFIRGYISLIHRPIGNEAAAHTVSFLSVSNLALHASFPSELVVSGSWWCPGQWPRCSLQCCSHQDLGQTSGCHSTDLADGAWDLTLSPSTVECWCCSTYLFSQL